MMNKMKMFRINFLLIVLAFLVLSIVGFVFYIEGSLIQAVAITGLLLTVFYVFYSITQSSYFRSNYVPIMLNEEERKTLSSLCWEVEEAYNKDISKLDKFISDLLKLESSIFLVTSALVAISYKGVVNWSYQAIVHDSLEKRNGLVLVQIPEGWRLIPQKPQYLIIYKNDPQVSFECKPYLKGGAPFIHLKAKSGGKHSVRTKDNIADQLDSIL